jgi:ferric-dicitrate binding protein FerR (iron transport regulator)
MTTPASPRPNGALADEDALKAAFLAHHATLSAEARSRLGDAVALTPKVVEGAFVRAWDQRSTIATPDDLRRFLVDDVHHAAARALSRRAAAHRFATHGATDSTHVVNGDVDPAMSWQHIQHALHGEEHAPGTLKALAAASRHEAAEHIATVGRSTGLWKAIALAVVTVVVLTGGMLYMNTAAAKGKVAKAVNDPDARPVITPAAKSGNVDLGDGSKVTVAPESKLLIPKNFSGSLRGVRLEGAATFSVAPGLKEQFQVFAGSAVIVAKGTEFTVSNYAADSSVTVVVNEGAVDVQLGEQVMPVAAGAGVVVKEGAPMRAATAEEIEIMNAWKTGTVILNRKPLRVALTQIKRWYGFDIVVPKADLLERPITIRASLDSAMQAVAQVEGSGGLLFGYYGENMAFSDSADKKLRRHQ